MGTPLLSPHCNRMQPVKRFSPLGGARIRGRRRSNRTLTLQGLLGIVTISGSLLSLNLLSSYDSSDLTVLLTNIQFSDHVSRRAMELGATWEEQPSFAAPLSTPSFASTASFGFLEPYDLSVNQLQVIPFWDGALPTTPRSKKSQGEATPVATVEDFLPIVTPMGDIDLRFRLRPKPTAKTTQKKEKKQSEHGNISNDHKNDDTVDDAEYFEAIKGISAYQIIAEMAHSPHEAIWNSGKVSMENHLNNNPNEAGASWLPSFVEWDKRNAPLVEGTIVRWRVQIWDALDQGPSFSDWAKFGVGPDSESWIAKWITHPTDYATLLRSEGEDENTSEEQVRYRSLSKMTISEKTCDLWKKRLPLPLARAHFIIDTRKKDQVVGALLVASGVGMFSVTMNGKRLSSSSVHDPPLTDFAQRVSYRGFDVTQEIVQQPSQHLHTVGITLAPGWWDHRPLNGAIVYMDFMSKGSPSAVAQLHVTYRDGTTEILIPTGSKGCEDAGTTSGTGTATKSSSSSSWKMGKGALIESNLFTGERLDLERQHKHRGWDNLSTAGDTTTASTMDWVDPQVYKGVDVEIWRQTLEEFAVEGKRKTMLSELGPIGSLVPLEIPPVLPVDKIAPVSTVRLGSRDDGRWLLDFGRGMSGVVRFEKGLPEPKVPKFYPRAHNLSVAMNSPETDRYISVVYGDSLEMSTGDINLALVAGFAYHTGGERGKSKNPQQGPFRSGGPCFPPEDLIGYQALTQRDVFVVPSNHKTSAGKLFREARQASFTVHGFRYAEVCCSEDPPTDAFAIQYRTAFPVWGRFDSSNPVFNGGKLYTPKRKATIVFHLSL